MLKKKLLNSRWHCTAQHPDFNVVTTFSFSLSYLHSHSHQFTPLFPSILLQLCASTIQLGLLDNVRGGESWLCSPFLCACCAFHERCRREWRRLLFQSDSLYLATYNKTLFLMTIFLMLARSNICCLQTKHDDQKWSTAAKQKLELFSFCNSRFSVVFLKKGSWTIIPAFIEKKKR